MENRNDINVGRWVDEQLEMLRVDDNWQPNSEKAQAMMQVRKRRGMVQRRNRILLVAGLSVCAVTFMVLSTPARISRMWNTAEIGTKAPLDEAPGFNLENVAGGRTGDGDLKGKVTVIDIFATWCVPCIKEIPDFNYLHETYQGKEVEIVAIIVESPYDSIAAKVREFGIQYEALVGNADVIAGFGGLVGFPTTFVLTRDWKVYKKYTGVLPGKRESIKNDIEVLLMGETGK